MTTLLLSFLVTLLQPAQPQGGGAGVVITREQLDAFVQPIIDDHEAQSIVVGIIDSSGTRVVGYGKLSAKNENPPDGKTVFEIGSITKTFTSTILASLKGADVVKLDDPVQQYLPDDVKIEVKDRPITLLDLATHRSGLPRMPDNFPSKNPKDPYVDFTEKELFNFLKSWHPSRAPESEIEYSNLGAGLLGYVLSKHTKMSYESLMHDFITGPLQMSDTTIVLTDAQKSRLAPPHSSDGKESSNWNFDSTFVGAGGIKSTCDDMLKFMAAQMNPPEGKLGEAINLTHESHGSIVTGRDVGMAWMIDAGGVCLWHNGETGGYHSFIAFSPSQQVGVVMLSNSANAPLDVAGSNIIRVQLGMPTVPAAEPRDEVKLSNEQLDRLTGSFQLAPDAILSIWRVDDKLYAQLAEQPSFRIFPESESKCFWKVVEAQVSFEFPDDKSPAKSCTLHQNGRDMPAARVAPATNPATNPTRQPK